MFLWLTDCWQDLYHLQLIKIYLLTIWQLWGFQIDTQCLLSEYQGESLSDLWSPMTLPKQIKPEILFSILRVAFSMKIKIAA